MVRGQDFGSGDARSEEQLQIERFFECAFLAGGMGYNIVPDACFLLSDYPNYSDYSNAFSSSQMYDLESSNSVLSNAAAHSSSENVRRLSRSVSSHCRRFSIIFDLDRFEKEFQLRHVTPRLKKYRQINIGQCVGVANKNCAAVGEKKFIFTDENNEEYRFTVPKFCRYL